MRSTSDRSGGSGATWPPTSVVVLVGVGCRSPLGLGFFAPKVETALSGAGWETTGSQSVQARQLIDKNFQGLSSYALMTVIYSPAQTVDRPRVQARARKRRAHAAR